MAVGDIGMDRSVGEAATSVEAAEAFRLPKLAMAERQLLHFPAGLENLHHLMDLDLSGNEISDADPAGLPAGLYTLVLTGNKLESIPMGLEYLADLQKLYLGANRIASCKDCCFGPNLLHVGLSYNLIADVKGIADDAPALMSLDLSNNNLDDLPATLEELKRLPHLRNLTLMGNPFCLLKSYRDDVKATLPKLVYLDGKALARADDLGQGEDAAEAQPEGDAEPQGPSDQAEVSASPEENDESAGADGGASPSIEDEPMLIPLKLDLRTLIVKDPAPPKAPGWLDELAEDAGGKGANKGKGEEELPRIPPVQYYVEFEGLEGEIVASKLTKKVEIDPFTIAETAPKEPKEVEKPGSKGKKSKGKKSSTSADGGERSVVTYASVLYQLQLSAATRDWLRNGFKMRLRRVSQALKRKVEVEATEKDPEQYSYFMEEEEVLVGEGTCRASDLVEAKASECKIKVSFTEIPALWDDKGIRMAIDDERHKTDPVGSIVASFVLHYEPPAEPVENDAPAAGKKK